MLSIGTKVKINPEIELDECTDEQRVTLTTFQQEGRVGEVIFNQTERDDDEFNIEVTFCADEADDIEFYLSTFWFRESELIIL